MDSDADYRLVDEDLLDAERALGDRTPCVRGRAPRLGDELCRAGAALATIVAWAGALTLLVGS